MDKTWPTTNQLLSWYLFRFLDGVPSSDLSPDDIKLQLEEFIKTPNTEVHRQMYEEYKEFREKHYPEDYEPMQELNANRRYLI